MKKLFLAAVALMIAGAASAQNELVQLFNEGAEAMNGKDFATAIEKFEAFIDNGMDSEDADVLAKVQTAKSTLPKAYQNLGARLAGKKEYQNSVECLTKGADAAELYGETQTLNTIKALMAKVYQVWGGEAFNNKEYAAAAEIFEKGYEANSRNTDLALNLAMSYCESGEYEKGMDVYRNVAAMPAGKYADAIAKANEMMAMYTNNEVAKLQAANDYDGIVAMAEKMLEANPADALAYKVRLQAYNGMKNYDKVIELGEESAAAQVTDEGRSDVYFLLGAAYNAKEQKDKAVAALRKVTAGANVEAAKRSVAELTK